MIDNPTRPQKKRAQLPTKWSDSGTRRRSSNRIRDDDDMAQKTVLIPGEVVDRAIDAQAEGKDLDLTLKCS